VLRCAALCSGVSVGQTQSSPSGALNRATKYRIVSYRFGSSIVQCGAEKRLRKVALYLSTAAVAVIAFALSVNRRH
jgi:hypothetical protein